MAEHVEQYCNRISRELRAEIHRISPQSLERFALDSRVWPIEAWLATRDPDGNRRLELIRVRPDPVCPDPQGAPLTRSWTHHLEPTRGDHGRMHQTIRECPLEIIGKCSFLTDIEKMLATYWEMDHDKPQGFLTSQ